MYAHGEGVPKDPKEALGLYRQACDAGETSGCIPAKMGLAGWIVLFYAAISFLGILAVLAFYLLWRRRQRPLGAETGGADAPSLGEAGSRAVLMVALGLLPIAILAWLTSAAFALFACAAYYAGGEASSLSRAQPAHLPAWACHDWVLTSHAIVGVVVFCSPLVVGLVWFRWWWGLVGLGLTALFVAISDLGCRLLVPSRIARLHLATLVWICAAVWLLFL
jgi:hypothetical protein